MKWGVGCAEPRRRRAYVGETVVGGANEVVIVLNQAVLEDAVVRVDDCGGVEQCAVQRVGVVLQAHPHLNSTSSHVTPARRASHGTAMKRAYLDCAHRCQSVEGGVRPNELRRTNSAQPCDIIGLCAG